jgi:hypothetical protein
MIATRTRVSLCNPAQFWRIATTWKTAVPAERHTQQESDLSFLGERYHYRCPHSI